MDFLGRGVSTESAQADPVRRSDYSGAGEPGFPDFTARLHARLHGLKEQSMTKRSRGRGSTGEGEGTKIQVLSENLAIDEDSYNAIVNGANLHIPRLERGVAYKAQDVIGREYWATLQNWPRRLAGQVLAHLVVAAVLPLRPVSCRYCTIKRYMRI